jgi:hypothetical protein
MNTYNCRLQDGTLKLIYPGQTRQHLYCPGCQYRYQQADCLFPRHLPDLKSRASNANKKYTPPPQRIIADIKRRWQELGRIPTLRDFGKRYGTLNSNTICNGYPGGYKEALKQAALELGYPPFAFVCEQCRQEFTTGRGLAIHRHAAHKIEEES